jgi:branched-chain amino acid transport system permease protein
MAYFIQLIVEGFATGSIYGALALAIVLVNRATGLINFAQGAMAVLATFVAYAATKAGVPLPVAFLIAFIFAFLYGAVVERLIVRKFEGGDPDTAVVVTIGLLLLTTGISALFFGYEPQQFPSMFPDGSIDLAGVFLSIRSVGTILVLLVVMFALQMLFRVTKIGLAMRAVADNPQSSALSGLPVSGLLMLGWALAALLGSVAGVLVAPTLFISPGMLDHVLVYALMAAILGGLDSPLGAVVAAWSIGIIENLAGAYVPFFGDDLKIAVPFLLVMVVMILRPQEFLRQQNSSIRPRGRRGCCFRADPPRRSSVHQLPALDGGRYWRRPLGSEHRDGLHRSGFTGAERIPGFGSVCHDLWPDARLELGSHLHSRRVAASDCRDARGPGSWTTSRPCTGHDYDCVAHHRRASGQAF